MRAVACLLLALFALTTSVVELKAQYSSLFSPSGSVFSQISPGTQWTGAMAGGTEVSLLGPGVGSPVIACPYAGASWRVTGAGVFSTAMIPGNITPKVTFGPVSVSRTITNLLAMANSARWAGTVWVTCVTVGTAGTMRVAGEVSYATGENSVAFAALNNDGSPMTVNNTSPLPVDVKVLIAIPNAANMFRLDLLAVERVF